ncbi:MAG TPA: MFS transporter, partial [Holophaga sp.]|nr:MFS transporter [Holophaga sp.]
MSLIERRYLPAFGALFASFILFGTSVTVIGAVLPRVLAEFRWGYLEAGSVLATGSVGYLLAAYLAGRAIDRIGFRTSMALGCALNVVGLLGFAATGSVAWNAFLYALIGVGQGFIEVAVNWSIIKMAPDGSGRPMSLMHGAFSVGAVAGPVAAGGFLALAIPWTLLYRAMAGLFLGLFAVALLVPARGLEGRAAAQAHHRAELHGEPVFWLGFVMLMLYVGVEMGLSNWVGEFFVSALGATAATGAFAVSAFWIGLLAGRFGVPLLYRGSRHDRVLWALGAILAVATLVLAASSLAGGLAVAFAASGLAGFGCSCIYPVAISMVGEAFPEVQGEAMGFASAGGGLGSCLFPLGLAFVARSWGIRAGFLALIP